MKVKPRKQTLFLLGGLLVMSAPAEMTIRADEKTQRYTIEDAGRPVLTYNFGPVPVPAGVTGKYAVARGDYVHRCTVRTARCSRPTTRPTTRTTAAFTGPGRR